MNPIELDRKNRILDMNSEDRPRERMVESGPQALRNDELLAILLRTGIKGENVVELANRILKEYNGLRGLKTISLEELQSIKGIGTAKSIEIMAAIELGRRFARLPEDNDSVIIRKSSDVFDYLHYEMESLDREELFVLHLNTRNQVVGTDKIYKGSVSGSTVRIAEIFQRPVIRNTPKIILAHNHPSGDPKPSQEDIAMTRAAIEAGKILEIKVLDHVIIGFKKYYSIMELLN